MSHPAGLLRIGNGAGFWGDRLDAPLQLAQSGQVDVLTLEYLAELTMAILAHLRSRDPRAGYAADFAEVMRTLVPVLSDSSPLRIVTNAGGLNPTGCAAVVGEILQEGSLGSWPVAVVTGDDVLADLPRWIADGLSLDHLETGATIANVLDRLVAANVYLGAQPIAHAITDQGARIVVTGRVADAALTLGPAAANFGWSFADYDLLAAGSVAGHLIECGAQVTGGLWRDWTDLPDPASIGYPIAEIQADGRTTITKPDGTGGRVSVPIVTEQLVYEIDDPSRYRTPDVDVNFTTVRLEQTGPDRVLISGATGRPPSGMLKLSAIHRDGWTASGMLAVVGEHAERKARVAGEVVFERLRRAGAMPANHLIECLGAGDVVPGVLPRTAPFEVVLRLTVRDPRREVVSRFCRELAPLVTAGPQGIAGYATGRPQPRPAFGYWPALVPADRVSVGVETRPAEEWVDRNF